MYVYTGIKHDVYHKKRQISVACSSMLFGIEIQSSLSSESNANCENENRIACVVRPSLNSAQFYRVRSTVAF